MCSLSRGDADRLVELDALFEPVIGQLEPVLGAAEVLDLHLLELARTEGEVARVDLVAERLADLRDAERHLDALAGLVADVFELDEDALRGLGAQVGGRAIIGRRAHLGLEHQVELARFGEVTAVLLRALRGLLVALLLADLIRAKTRLAGAAIDHRVRESADVPGGLEDVLVGEDRAVEADDVVALVYMFAPPVVFEVALQLGAERPVVPAAVESAVDLGGLEDEAAAFAQAHDLLHFLGVFGSFGIFGHGAHTLGRKPRKSRRRTCPAG